MRQHNRCQPSLTLVMNTMNLNYNHCFLMALEGESRVLHNIPKGLASSSLDWYSPNQNLLLPKSWWRWWSAANDSALIYTAVIFTSLRFSTCSSIIQLNGTITSTTTFRCRNTRLWNLYLFLPLVGVTSVSSVPWIRREHSIACQLLSVNLCTFWELGILSDNICWKLSL